MRDTIRGELFLSGNRRLGPMRSLHVSLPKVRSICVFGFIALLWMGVGVMPKAAAQDAPITQPGSARTEPSQTQTSQSSGPTQTPPPEASAPYDKAIFQKPTP